MVLWFTYYYSRNIISVNCLKTHLKVADEPEISTSLTFKDWNALKQLGHNFFMVLVVKKKTFHHSFISIFLFISGTFVTEAASCRNLL